MEMVTSRHTTAYEATPQVCTHVQAMFYVGLCTHVQAMFYVGLCTHVQAMFYVGLCTHVQQCSMLLLLGCVHSWSHRHYNNLQEVCMNAISNNMAIEGVQVSSCTYLHTYIYTYTHSHIHTYIHTYTYSHIHTYRSDKSSILRELDMKRTQLLWETNKLSDTEARLHHSEQERAMIRKEVTKLRMRLQETMEKVIEG